MSKPDGITNSERKDRSIRLWGERGQLALEQGHVCVLNATALATEVLKNLVLPGVGKFTVVDNQRVAERDLGNNFFVTQQSLGEPRCKVITNLLLELNEEVEGTAVEEDPVELINSSPDFFAKFSCVVATDLPEPALLKLAGQLWVKQVPLCVGRAYGMIGMWRNVLPEVCVIESRPEYTKENYRIASPFPELQAFAAQYDIDTCKHPHLPLTETPAGPGKYTDSQGRPVVPKAHSHTPAFVVLIKVLEKWRATHEGTIPRTSSEKDALREMLDEMQVSVTKDEENFIEAKQLARHAYAPFEIPSEVKAILADPKVQDDSACLEPFW